MNIEVGGTLQLNLLQVDAEVDVCTGDNLEEIELKAWWKHNVGAAVDFNNIVTQKNNSVCVDLQYNEKKAFLKKLVAVMPGRWCNLLLEGGKGHVTIQNTKEANINVMTTGGGVTLGELRGNEAFIKSNGGFVTAELISAVFELKTGGGNLLLKRAIGTAMQIDTDGGDMVIGSAYGEDVQLKSGGGCIEIKHIQAHQMAHVSSDGGDVQIYGLDGNAEILSGGGNVQLQLLANAKEVKINAGVGEVTLYLSSEDDIKVEHAESGRCHEKDSVQEFDGELCSSCGSSDMSQGIGHARCRVFISGSGNVITRKRSWLQAVMQSTSSKAI